MIDKPLHAGNIAVAIASAATAADLTFTAGAGAAITSMLSGVELFKKSTRDQKSLAKSMATDLQRHLDNSHLTPDRKKITVQMLERFPPGKTDLAAGNMDAATIAANMRAQISATDGDGAHRTPTALDDYTAILTATLTPYLEPQTEEQAVQQELLARTDALLKQSETSGQSDRLRDEGITEKAIIRLAQRIARDTDDVGQAWLELQNAMDIAIRVQHEGRVKSNQGDFVDEVLKRVADLSAEGDFTSASAAIADALAEEDASHQARKIRLLESGIEVAMLEGDATRAAALLVQKADLDAGGSAAFADLCAVWQRYYVKGRDKGTSLDPRIAIAIATLVVSRATTSHEQGAALNDLGLALAILGQRESGTDRLEQAVTAYESALREFTRDRAPLEWARTQMNLGAALQILGQRESGTDRLELAVTAYENALQEFTRDRVPLDWALTQMNLGLALRILGEHESGSDRLEQAVAACQDALEERTRDRAPLGWAMTQMNLGNALLALGQRESSTDRLEQAVTAYENALREFTRDRVPLDWAGTQMNLGNALQSIGQLESGTDRLERAVTAYEKALQEWTRDRVPLDWAMMQMNLGNALKTLGERESGTDWLEQAVTAYENALEEYTLDRVPLGWARTQGNLAILEGTFFDKTGDAAHLDRAMIHASDAREVFEEAGASQYLTMIDNIIAGITARRDGGKTA